MNIQAIIAKLKQYPIAVGGVVFILVFGAAFFMRKSKAPELEGERVKLEKKWQDIVDNTREATDIATHMEKISEYSAETQSRLMVRESKALNQQYFYGLEEETGLSLTLLAQSDAPPPPRPPPGKPNLTLYSPVDFSVSVTGTFSEVLDFLYRLENGRYFTRIEGFSTSSTGGADTDQIQISLKMDILGQKIN